MANSPSNTQTHPPFDHKQREMMAQLLRDARKRVQDGLESDYDLEARVRAQIIPTLVEKAGASRLLDKVRKLQKELEHAEKELSKRGFEYSCGADRVSLESDAPKKLREASETAYRQARAERDAVLKRYDLAMLQVAAAASSREAKEVVKELI